MRIATWNVNSVNQRVESLVAWLKARAPDVVCLQEIKCQETGFPREPLEALGYNLAILGQKTFNGVAILSKFPLEDVSTGLPGDADDVQSRFITATVSSGSGSVKVVCLYLPNGNPVNTEKYPYKLKWMDRLIRFTNEHLKSEEPLVLAGDYNVIPAAADVHNPEAWLNDALFLPQTRAKFRELANLGMTDALRTITEDDGLYTFWDYQAGAWQKNNGIRIDHLMLSPQAADKLSAAGIDKHVRAWEKPSDHVPVWIDLDFEKK
jgi:exodeoxyribonuclease-3